MFSRDTVDTLQGHVTIQEIKSSQRPHYTKRYGLGWYPATEKKGCFKYTSCTKNGIILIILVVTTDTAVCGMASRFFPVHPQLKPPRPQVWCVFTDIIYIYICSYKSCWSAAKHVLWGFPLQFACREAFHEACTPIGDSILLKILDWQSSSWGWRDIIGCYSLLLPATNSYQLCTRSCAVLIGYQQKHQGTAIAANCDNTRNAVHRPMILISLAKTS